jgi:hypothetical protein
MTGAGGRHAYGSGTATHEAKTEYGTFRLCAACVNAGHAGVKRPGAVVTRLGLSVLLCQCEHVAHFNDDADGMNEAAK